MSPRRSAPANASNVAGSKVTFNVTALVQRTSDGDFDSRYTRLSRSTPVSDAKESYREYYSSEDTTASRRPTLTIVLGSGSTPPPPPPSAPASSTLKVLQWNIAQGYGQDGKSNIDRVVAFIVSKRPDVISFNEIMRYSSSSQPQIIADKLRARTGETWTYNWVQKSGASSGEGECVMTRLDVDATDDYLAERQPVGRHDPRERQRPHRQRRSPRISIISRAPRALAQVRQLVAWADNHSEQRIIAGDFNGWPGTAEINEMAENPQRRLGGCQEQRRGRVLTRGIRTATRGTRASTTCGYSKGAIGACRDPRGSVLHARLLGSLRPQCAHRDVPGSGSRSRTDRAARSRTLGPAFRPASRASQARATRRVAAGRGSLRSFHRCRNTPAKNHSHNSASKLSDAVTAPARSGAAGAASRGALR